MRIKTIVCYTFFLAIVFFFSKLIYLVSDELDFTQTNSANFPGSMNDYILLILKSLFTILICWIIARKADLMVVGGFRVTIAKYKWMLIIPLFVPGVLMFSLKKYDCINFTLFYVVYFFLKLIAATMEEVVFRGIILGHLRKNYPNRSVHFYCLVSAFFFALVHLTNLQYAPLISVITQIFYAFFMGLLFGIIMLHVGNVWLLGITHGILNLVTINVCEEIKKTNIEQYSNRLSDIGVSVLGVIFLLIPVLLIYFVLTRLYVGHASTGNHPQKTG